MDMFCLINLMRYFPWLINIDRYYIITQTTNTPHTAICFYCLCKEAALRGRGGEGGGVVMVDIRSGLLPVLALLSLPVLSPPSPLSPLIPLSLPESLLSPAAHNPLQRAKGSYHEAKSTLCAGSCTGSGQIYGLYQRFFPARPLE